MTILDCMYKNAIMYVTWHRTIQCMNEGRGSPGEEYADIFLYT